MLLNTTNSSDVNHLKYLSSEFLSKLRKEATKLNRMSRMTLLLFILFFTRTLSAQLYAPIKWGDIPADELAMTVYEKDTLAEAVVLADYGLIDINEQGNFFYTFYKHKRIKILDKNAFNEGNIAIPFYKGDRIYAIKAQTINPDGTITKVDSKNIFEEDVHEYLKVKKFSFPNLQVGCIIEYEYEKRSERIVHLEEWYFQGELPVKYSELVVKIPAILEYIFLFQGKEKKEGDEAVDGFVEIKENQFIMRNAAGLKEEAYITSMDNYRARLRFQLSKIWWRTRPPETFMTTWEEVAKELKYKQNFGKQYLFKRFFSKAWKEVEPLLATATTEEEKIQLIYTYVQEKLDWNGFIGRYTSTSLNEVFTDGKGSVAEINLLLVALLKQAAIEASPMLCSTRNSGKPYSKYPIVDQFNYLVAHVKQGDKSILLDASKPYHPLGYIYKNVLNYKGWVVDSKEPYWEKLEPKMSSKIFWTQLGLNEQGHFAGTFKGRFSGYAGISERSKYHQSEGNHWKEHLTAQIPNLKINAISYEAEKKLDQPFSTEIEFVQQVETQEVGNYLYIAPVFYTEFGENPLKLEKREYPIEFMFPMKEQSILNFIIPEGYEVEALPDNIKLMFPNKEASFTYLADLKEDMITITTRIEINQLVYSSESYPAVKGFFDSIVEAFEEQIVLKKK